MSQVFVTLRWQQLADAANGRPAPTLNMWVEREAVREASILRVHAASLPTTLREVLKITDPNAVLEYQIRGIRWICRTSAAEAGPIAELYL